MEKTACHTASIITLGDQKYLVDVAIPLHCALPVSAGQITRRSSQFHRYTIRPDGHSRYTIERSHHPKRKIFSLVDKPIALETYQLAVQNDYEATGYFLDRVIIVKVIGDRLWRFSSADTPHKLEGFDKTSQQEIILGAGSLARTLAMHFEIAEEKIALALSYLPIE